MTIQPSRPNKIQSEQYVVLDTSKLLRWLAAMPVDGDGAELFTASNPGAVSGVISSITELANVTSVDTIDEVSNVTSVDTVDSVTSVASVTAVDALPSAVQGPGNPVVLSYTSASITLSANTANQTVVAAQGANKQIWVYAILLVADTDAGTIALQDEDDTALTGAIAVSDEGGFAMQASGNFAMPLFKVATNKALEADTVTCSAAGIISYAVVSVT